MDAATVPDRRAGSLYFLAERLETHANFAEVIASLLAGHGATLGGVWGSSCALAAAAPALAEEAAGQAEREPAIVVTAARTELSASAPHSPVMR